MLSAGFACLAQTPDLATPARRLAARIAPIAPGRSIALTVENRSSLAAADVDAVRGVLGNELRRAGVRLDPNGLPVEVTLSEDWNQLVWVARTSPDTIAIVTQPRFSSAPASAGTPVTIERRLLWEQDEPVLDYAENGNFRIILEPSRLKVVEGSELRFAYYFPHTHPMPRDPRGRLIVDGERVQVYLPELSCEGSATPQLRLNCKPGAVPWPLEGGAAAMVEGRNYFEGGYYSSARTASGEVVYARLNGGPPGVGSDLASVSLSDCGQTRILLASAATDSAEPDRVTAYQTGAGGFLPVAEPVAFPGPLTALWTAGESALAIVRQPRPPYYAAYRLTPGCSR